MGDRYTGKPSLWPTTWVNSALHPSRVAKSSTSFGRGKGGNVTSAGWQVTLCDPMWYVSSRSGDGRLACKLLYALSLSFSFYTQMVTQLSTLRWTVKQVHLDFVSDFKSAAMFQNECGSEAIKSIGKISDFKPCKIPRGIMNESIIFILDPMLYLFLTNGSEGHCAVLVEI